MGTTEDKEINEMDEMYFKLKNQVSYLDRINLLRLKEYITKLLERNSHLK